MPELELGDWKNQDAMGRWIIWQQLWASMLFPTNMKPENPSLRKDYLITMLARNTIIVHDKKILNANHLQSWLKKYFHPNGGLDDLLNATKFDDMKKKNEPIFKRRNYSWRPIG